jgi:type II secretory pathway component PulC
VQKSIYVLGLISCGFFAQSAFADFYTGTAPYRPFDEIEGFNLMERNPETQKFLNLGVKSTDIVVSVNGNPIRSLASAKKAYAVAVVKEVIVLREHRPLTLGKAGASR